MKTIITKYFLLVGLFFPTHSLLAIDKDHGRKFTAVWKFKDIEGNQGSGFFIAPNRFVTALHVIEDAIQDETLSESYLHQNNHSSSKKIKKVIALSLEMDLALLETEDVTFSYLNVREDNLPEPLSENLYILGYPDGEGLVAKNFSQINRHDYYLYFDLHPNNKVLTGISGGPVIDSQGQVVAVAVSAYKNTVEVISLRHFIQNAQNFSCEGETIKSCLKKRRRLLQQGAKKGNISAAYRLGFIYDAEGKQKQAKKWLSLAAEQGHPIAMNLLSTMLSIEKEVLSLIKKSAEAGYTLAQNKLKKLTAKKNSECQKVFENQDTPPRQNKRNRKNK